MPKRTPLNLLAGFALVFLTHFAAIAQPGAVQARHETDAQTSTTLTLTANLGANYTCVGPCLTNWSVTIGGAAGTISSVVGASGSNLVTVTFTPAVGIGQAVVVNHTNDGIINNVVGLVSQNNRAIVCDDFAWAGTNILTPPCAPVDPITRMTFSVKLGARNSSAWNINNLRVRAHWIANGAVPYNELVAYESDLSGTPTPSTYFITGDAASSAYIYPANDPVCGYTATYRVLINGTLSCSFTNPNQQVPYASHNNDDTGVGADVAMPATVAFSDQVCLGNNVNMTFTDATDLNCNPTTAPIPTNDAVRWVRVVYGSTDLGGGNTATSNIPNIHVDGVEVTDNNGALLFPGGYIPPSYPFGTPDAFGVVMVPPSVTTPRGILNLITTTSSLGQMVGQRFWVRLDYWNTCNAYDGVGDLSNLRRSIENEIEIITIPTLPTPVNKEYCFTETIASGGSCGTPTGEYFEINGVAGSNRIRWYNTLANAISNGNADTIASSYGRNCRFLRPENRAGGVAAMAAAGTYSVWARYRTGAAAPNNCWSDPVEVTITRRSSLSVPGTINPLSSDICDGATNVAYNLTNPSPVVAIGGTTEYLWVFNPAASGATVDAPNTAQNITADFSVGGSFLTVTRTLEVRTQFTTDATTGGRCAVGPSSRTVTIYGPTLGGAAAGGANYCQGADVNNISLSGQNGSIVRWELDFNSTGFVDAGVGSVTSFDPGVLPPGSYVYRAIVANGPCSQQTSTATTIIVFATPTTATAGADQPLCQSLVIPSAGLGGNTPVVGTGAWSLISGPGTITFNPTSGTPNATATASAQGIYVVRWTISTGAGLCSSFENVQLDFGAPPATPDAGPLQDICASSTNLNGTAPTIETGTWSVSAAPLGGTVSFSNVNSPTATVSLNGAMVFGTYTLRWRFTSGTCVPTEDFVDITFRQAPTATAPADFTACVDSPPTAPFNINLSGTFGGGASNAHWERVVGTGTFTSSGGPTGSSDGSNPVDDVYVPTAADFTAGSVQVRLVTDDPTGACTSVNDPVTIMIDRLPGAAVAGGPFSTCDATATLGATAATNGGIGTWTVGGALYYETFPTPDNGLGITGPSGAATFNHPGANWSVSTPAATLLDNSDWIRVDAGHIAARDVSNNEVVWQSAVITIAGSVNVSADIAEFGTQNVGDYIRVYYKINGGAEVQFGQISGEGVDGVFQSMAATTPVGTTVQIVMRARNDGGADEHRLDNVWVSAAGTSLPLIADVNSPTSGVSNLQVGVNIFTWTVRSALGVCGSSNAAVTVTRHPAPVALDPAPELCDEAANPTEATVSAAYLNSVLIRDGITGIAGSADRTVQYFIDALRTIAVPDPYLVSNGEIIYTRVTSTNTTPNCVTDGVITFTINLRPTALDQNPEFCEDAVGSNTRTGINLTNFNSAVKNNVAANTVAWFSDALLTIPVAAPTSVTANNGTIFYAQVTDPNGCSNDAEVEITLNPIPGPNALIGPTDVCADPTAVTLYQLTVNNVGYTYAWSIPEPPFDRIIGGTATDFLVLLSFPTVATNSISVIETSDKGCVGAANIRNITVDTSPPAITILDNPLDPLSSGPGAVCANETGVIYTVAALANTTYSWTVPPGSSIIAGQGSNQITVNFGTIAGLISVVPTTTTGCAGNPDDYSVAINPRPTLNTSPNTVCSDAPASITLSGIGATSFNITSVSVPPGLSPASRSGVNGAPASEIFNDVFTNTTGGNLTVQYSVEPVSALGCEGAAQIVNLTIRPEPVLAPNLNDVICSRVEDVGVVLSVATGSFPADQFVIASITNASGLTQTAGAQTIGPGTFHTSGVLLDDRWLNLTGAVATIEYMVHPRNSGTTCLGDPAIPVIITVNPEPIVPVLAPETICSGSSPTTTISPSIPLSTFNWTGIVTGLITGNTTGSGPFGTTITDILLNSAATSGSVNYTITATGPAALGSCTGQAQPLLVTVDPSPTANNITAIECSDTPGGNTMLIDLTTLQSTVNNGGGVTFTWSQNFNMTPPIAAPASHTLTNGVPVYVEVDNGQCQKVATVLYTINPNPSVTASIATPYNGFQLSCNGASDGSITAVPANGVGPYLFSINGGTSFFTTTTFNGLSTTGNPYVVRTRDSNGCIADSPPLTIVAPPAVTGSAAITSNFNGEDVSCQTSANGVITVTPGGGTGAGTYTFRLLELPSNTTGDANGIYTGLRAGTYTFVVRDGNSCQFTTPTITVTEPSPITATAALTSPVTCNGNSNGVITVTASGGTLISPNYSFTIAPGGTNNTTGIFNGLAAGNYTVTVVDDNGCPKVSNVVSVTQPSILTAFASVTSNYNGAKISCVGADDGEITATANGGNGGFSYVLDQDLSNTSGAATGVFINLGPGSYSITVTDAGPCSVTSALVTVTEPTPISGAALVTGTISCNGGSDGQITVSGTGGTGAYTFEQTSPAGPTNASGIFGGLNQGSYDFEVSDLNGCTDAVTLPLTQPTAVTASAAVTSNYNGAQVTCNGASNGVITVTGAGGTGSLNYVFDQFVLTNTTGQFTGVFSGVPAGTNYTFTVKDSKNCTVTSLAINVTQPTVVAASGSVTSNYTGEDIRCVGSSDGQITVTSSGGTGAYNYTLDQVPSNTTGDASGIYTGLSAGTFTITARDVNNCFIVTTPIVITPPPALTGGASITSNYNGRQLRCFGSSDGIITVTSGGGVGGFEFILNEIPGNTTGAVSGVFTGVPSGTYTVTMTDDNTCQRVTTAVTINDPPVLTAASAVTSSYNGAQVSCNGASDGVIKVTPTGGTATYSYAFVQIPGNTTGATTGIFTGIPAGAYTFNVLDVNNCPVTTTSVTISQPTPVTASAVVDVPYNGQQISCNGVDDGTITVTAAGGTGAISYVFDQFALTNLSGKFSGIFSGVGAGTGYTFTATDINGCPVTTSAVTVVEPAAIAATLNATSNYNGFDISCFNLTDGEVSVITPTGGTGTLTYLLLENPGNVTGQNSGVFTGLRAGSYRVRITDQNFCQFLTAAIPVTQPTDLNVQIAITSNFNGYDVSCIGASDGAVSVTTIAGGATATSVTYTLDQILTNTSGNASGVYTGLPSNLYTVTATDANGCPKTSLPVVLIDPLPLFEGIVGLDKSVCEGSNPTAFTELAAAFGGIGNYSYQWQQSTDGVLFSNVLGATSATFDPPVLPITTFFKRRITSGTCSTLESNTVSVTVNPLPTATLVPSKSPVCEGDFFLLNFTFTGQAPFYFDYNDGTTFTNDRLGASVTPVPVLNYTNTTTYTVTELRDFNGCVATLLPAPVTVPVVKINPVFSITSSAAQCSGGEFDFTFTVDPDTEYTWIWGDGDTEVIAPNTLPVGPRPISHIYESMNTAGTTNFPVILTAINPVQGCGPKQTNQTVQIYPNILINLFPDKTEICGGDQITFTNPTAGGTTHHWFYREQGVVEERDERTFVAASDQTFTFNNTTVQNPIIYELVYEVTNANCAADTVIEVTVYREVAASFSKTTPVPLFIGGNANMTFTNTSVPIDAAEFQYDWDFGTAAAQAPVSGTGPFNFNYTAPGTKTVRLVATNLIAVANGIACKSEYQETFNIVLPPLVAGFEYTPQAICFPANITITRNLATGNSFEWRLVDGTGRQLLVTNDTLPTFTISSAGRYTIFQTTKNTLTGQTASADNSATGNNIAPYNRPIDIYETPFAGFEARPTVVYVPDTQLQVFNMSSSPVDPLTATSYPIEYRWYFGDGTDTLSTADSPENFEPSHFYINEGPYDIALLAVNDHGNGAICYDTAIKRIQAKAAGFTRVPNAFTPSPNGPTGGVGAGGNSVNDVFLPVAKGIVDFQMQIFDRWGNLIFESNDKTIGWDGYDKNGNLLPAGVYVYKLVLRLSNDQRTTQIGDVTLIR
jgi:gliding motility-associated-like protein